MVALAGNSAALIDEVDISARRGARRGHQGQHQGGGRRDRDRRHQWRPNRVYTAILLTLAAPEYLVQK